MSMVYEPVPPGHEGPVNLLRSLPHPPKKAYVRFCNATNCIVTVKWIDFEGKLKNFRTLGLGDYFDCNTFVDHAWVFRDLKTYDALCVDNKQVFWPAPKFEMIDGQLQPKRTNAIIHRPMLSLSILAARTIRDSLKTVIEPFCLELPFHLQMLVVKLILDNWDARPERRPNSPFPVPEDPENMILRRDFDDFQCNILYISYRLSIHAKKLLTLAKQGRGSGEAALTRIGVLETIIRILGYDLGHNEMGTHTRKLAPIIWKQMIFLRVHLDTLQTCCGHMFGDRFRSYYDNLVQLVHRRLKLMFPQHQDSLEKYHWQQLCLLTGNLNGNSENIREDPAYSIPELLPLNQRTEWEWIELRRRQLKDHPNRELMLVFLGLTSNMLQTTNRLENIFQVLCILHFNLTGKQLTEELPSEDEDHPVLIKVA